MVDFLDSEGFDVLFAIGGDGTLAGALEISKEGEALFPASLGMMASLNVRFHPLLPWCLDATVKDLALELFVL